MGPNHYEIGRLIELAGVGETPVGEHGLRYHAGESKHGQAAVGDLLKLHVRLVTTKKTADGQRRASGYGQRGGGRGSYQKPASPARNGTAVLAK